MAAQDVGVAIWFLEGLRELSVRLFCLRWSQPHEGRLTRVSLESTILCFRELFSDLAQVIPSLWKLDGHEQVLLRI